MGPLRGLGAWAGVGRPRLHSGPVPPNSKFPQTAAEWAEVLALQKQFHSVEVHKWRQILRASVELLDEVRPRGWGTLHSHPRCGRCLWASVSSSIKWEAIHSPPASRVARKIGRMEK